MTFDEAKQAFIDAAQRTMEAYKALEAAQAAEKKARELFAKALEQHTESKVNA
jgi:hypothetical protein